MTVIPMEAARLARVAETATEPGSSVLADLLAELLGLDLRQPVTALIIVFGPRQETSVCPGPGQGTSVCPEQADTPAGQASEWESITARERTVATLVGQGLTNQQVARRTGITPSTVNFHLRQIYRKLGINSRVQLARLVAERTAA